MSSRYVKIVQTFEGFVVAEGDDYIEVGDSSNALGGRTFVKGAVVIEDVDLPPQPSWWPPQAGDVLAEGVNATPDALYLATKRGVMDESGLTDQAEIEKKARYGEIDLHFRKGGQR